MSSEAVPAGEATESLTLAFEQRQKSRLRARLDSGEEVALLLPRGRVLRGGDRLVTSDGAIVAVQARAEEVSRVRCEDARTLARAAYHLGNRHVPVEVGATWLQYRHDHVLDDMVRALGLTVDCQEAPFEPEAGAYGAGASHAHGHGHAHSHTHGDSDLAPRLHRHLLLGARRRGGGSSAGGGQGG